MARYLDSRFGKIKPYRNNPRTISDAAFTKLCASIERDPEFMAVRPIVIDENNAILGGNQRQYALLSLGYERVPDEWIRQVTGWTEERKQRFVLVDNSPEGMAGSFDYDIMSENFSPSVMADAGIDFANIDSSVTEESFKTSEEKAEEAPGYGEKDKALQDFKQHREMAREAMEDMTDASYYLGVVFQSESQKREFLEKSGLASDGMFASGLALAESMGIDLQKIEFKFPEARLDRTLVEMAMENDQEPRKGASAEGN